MLQVKYVTMHVYLSLNLTCFHCNALKQESEFSLCYFQYFGIDKKIQKKLQCYSFLDQSKLVID